MKTFALDLEFHCEIDTYISKRDNNGYRVVDRTSLAI